MPCCLVVLALLARGALASVPTPPPGAGTDPRTVPTVEEVHVLSPIFHGTPNTMMFTLVVRADHLLDNSLHDAVVGHVPASEFQACDGSTSWSWSSNVQRFAGPTDTLEWTLYNFLPEVPYRYVVRTGAGGNYRYACGDLPLPTLPGSLAALNFRYDDASTSATRYVLLDMDDCGASGASSVGGRSNFLVLDTANQAVVWYADLVSMTGLADPAITGWRYQPASALAPARILAIVDKRHLYVWGMDGQVLDYRDFAPDNQCSGGPDAIGPCIHHDAIQSPYTGRTFVVTTRESRADGTGTEWEDCGADSHFLNDGFQVLDNRFATHFQKYLMRDYDYDPVVDPGPEAHPVDPGSPSCAASTWARYLHADAIDWTHANSIDVALDGKSEVVDLSLHAWNQIVRFDAVDGTYLWTLASDPLYSDLGRIEMAPGIAGKPTFAGQHDVHTVADDTLLMLDNRGDLAVTRVLRVTDLSSSPTVDRAWPLVDARGAPFVCPVEGSAQEVPGTAGENVLASCPDEYAVVELDASQGYPAPSTIEPPLVITIPDGTTEPFCSVGGPSSRTFLRGLYRAYPLEGVGDFD
jgi:hypothetical protein